MVIDSHVHAWGPPSPDYPWTNQTIVEYAQNFSVDIVYTAEKLCTDMEAAGIDQAILVGYPIGRWTDNRYTVNAVREYDPLQGIVMLDPFDENSCEILRNAMEIEGILGFRLGATYDYDSMWREPNYNAAWMADLTELTEFWDTVTETNAVVQIATHPSQINQSLSLIESYPDLNYLFDHFVGVNATDVDQDGAVSSIEGLSQYESVGVKISAAPYCSDAEFPYPDIHSHIRWLLETFGRERVIWGSDFPNVSDTTSYQKTLEWLDYVDCLSRADRRWLTELALPHHLELT